MVDEHAVTSVGQVERHIFVCLLAACATVGIPNVDHLAVLHQGTESLAKAVHDLANSQAELLADIRPVRVGGNEGHSLVATARQQSAASEKLQRPPIATFKAG